jgi:hypothetical protein
MKKQFIKLSCLTICFTSLTFAVNAQNVGINSSGAAPNSSAMLDIDAANNGLLIPRVALQGTSDVLTVPTPAVSLLIYNTANSGSGVNDVQPGYYYWNGTTWEAFYTSQNGGYTYGEIRSVLKLNDFDGWIKLDGRSVSSLTASQQAAALALGFTSTIPDATDAFLAQNGSSTLGVIVGSNSVVLTQANLPNVNFVGTTSTDGNHTHDYTRRETNTTVLGGSADLAADNPANTFNTSASGLHSHTATVSTGGVSAPINVAPKSLNVTMFIYLGL